MLENVSVQFRSSLGQSFPQKMVRHKRGAALMNQPSLEQRIDRLVSILRCCESEAGPRLAMELIPKLRIDRLAATPGCPEDIRQILCTIGNVRNWGHRGAALIDWWCPCEIAVANDEERCPYEVQQENFTNGSDLLFFAWDCDARVYFYDTSFSPWRIVTADGLGLTFVNSAGPAYQEFKNDFTPFEPREDGRDAISIIEYWALSVQA
jgi:hypothetical protein